MEEIYVVSTMSVLVLLSAFCSIVLGKLKFPALIGFILAGIIIVNFLHETEEMYIVSNVLSNLGLIMLMFSIGMEIDIRKLKNQGKFAIIVAAVQLPLMVLGGVVAGLLLGFTMLQCITLGCIISGSSTAVVMAVLKSQGQLDNEHIELLVLITIMEDIGQVIMLSLLTPMLGGSSMSMNSLIILILGITVFMIACFTLGLYIVPRVIDWFYERTNDELISLLCIGAAFTLAWAAYGMGLSVAIGAFLAGVFVGTTRPKHAVEHFVGPLKSLFMAMFFISVGMEVTLNSLVNNLPLIMIIFAVFAVCKFSTVYLGYWVGNGDSKNGFISAMALCAMGEFAFIIAKEALNHQVVNEAFYSSVIGAALVSMIVLPLLTRHSEAAFDILDAKTPNFLRKTVAGLSRRRDNLYRMLDSLSTSAKNAFTKGLANIYFIILIIAFIEILFYYAYDPLCQWMVENLGYDDITWRIVLLLLNLACLLTPCDKLVAYLRLTLYVINEGKKNIEVLPKQLSHLKDGIKFHEVMSPLIIGAIVAIFLVVVVPNGIESIILLNISVALISLLLIYQIWKFKSGRKGPAPPQLDENGPIENN